jgi:hypothetical protein
MRDPMRPPQQGSIIDKILDALRRHRARIRVIVWDVKDESLSCGHGCLFFFLAAQTFQSIALAYWIPAAQTAQENLATYLLPVDQARAALVGVTILLLIVPYLVIALRYFGRDPVFSLLGFVFGVGFIGAECAQRSIDFFLVGARWARELNDSSGITREILLRRFDLWNDITAAWYFPLLLRTS